ncbi:MAG: NAD-dependent epimerase/dehydratase family protein [Microcystis sp.]|uniref:NAD-dependent epimerase/dehydratase family protein n=1 Tax=Microcystis sp. TaxID=1127 RepID=UPI00391D667A
MKKIFLTGVSGCIGHYIAEILLENPDYELYFLVRNAEKLKFTYQGRSNVHILLGDMQNIGVYAELLKTMNIAVLIATSWGGEEESYQINVVKTLELISYLDAQICEKVLYFSTASILNQNNQPLPEAGEIGTNYIRTKYICYSKFTDLEIADKIITLYPTFVLGGDENKPYSHIYGGLPDVLKYIGLVRWFQADGSFHFIHAKDIAQVVNYLIENPAPESKIVLGNQRTTANQAVEEICTYLNKKIYFRIPLSLTIANFFIKVFNLQMEPWDRFAMNYRHFTHVKTYTPADFGLKNHCSTLDDVLTLRGIPRKKP